MIDNVGVQDSSCTPSSGGTFSLGTTTVTCSANDEAGNVGTASFDVTVVDTEPPEQILPPDITAAATDANGAFVSIKVGVRDNVGVIDGDCSYGSGVFPLGETTVTCWASDAAGNTTTGSFTVSVVVDETSVEVLSDGNEALELDSGTAASLQAPLRTVARVLGDDNPDNDDAACDKLDDFIANVQAKHEQGRLTVDEADQLIWFAVELQSAAGCGL